MQPIDVVYTWVSNTKEHQEARAYWRSKERTEPKDNSINRYSDNGEIKFSIRSIYMNIPWVRKIFIIVADGQRPPFLSNATVKIPIQIVTHSELYGEEFASHLPTFNSQSIETHLHRIPDLSEHFIYFNDDMFIGRPLSPQHFFTEHSENPRYIFSKNVVIGMNRETAWSMHSHAWINNCNWFNKYYKFRPMRPYPAHQPVAMLKSSFVRCWELAHLRNMLMQTSASKFRHPQNLYFIGFLVFWNCYSGKAAKSNLSQYYVNLDNKVRMNDVYNYIIHNKPSLICLNDSFTHDSIDRTVLMKHMLHRLFDVVSEAESS